MLVYHSCSLLLQQGLMLLWSYTWVTPEATLCLGSGLHTRSLMEKCNYTASYVHRRLLEHEAYLNTETWRLKSDPDYRTLMLPDTNVITGGILPREDKGEPKARVLTECTQILDVTGTNDCYRPVQKQYASSRALAASWRAAYTH